jgi:hypothetical protein
LIHGFFEPDPYTPAPRVRVSVDLRGVGGVKHPSDPIDFLIDTGASSTILHPADAVGRVGIKKARLQDRNNRQVTEAARGVGGEACRFIVPCHYTFRHDDGGVLVIDGGLRIAEATAYNEACPSLLGRDVLRHFALTIAPARDEVMLDHLM